MQHPLFFNHGGLVAGRGFVAHVAIHGRCLLEQTEPDFYTYFGVSPAATAGQGCDPSEARRGFLENVRTNVRWIAAEAEGFDAFRAALEKFVLDQSEPLEQMWDASVKAVRSGALDTSGYTTHVNAEQAAKVVVGLVAAQDGAPSREKRVRIQPDLNEVEDELLLACA